MKAKANDKRESVGASIAIAASIACAFLALIALAITYGGSETFADHAQSATADLSIERMLSGFVIVSVPALAVWGISINHRCINTTVRRILMALAFAMAVWLCAASIATVWFNVSDPPLMSAAVLSDLALALVIEAYIDSRIVPSIHRYRILFRRLPFDLKILNEGGRVIFKTDIAHTLDYTTLWQIAKQGPSAIDEETPSIFIESLPNSVFKPFRLNAGMALLTEDASKIVQLRKRLEQRQEQLENQNEILRRNHAMQSLLFRQRRERELEVRVERDLAETAAQIRSILDELTIGDDRPIQADRLQQLNLVKVLVAYSKRKGMLALAAAESETLSSEQFKIVAQEARADLNSIGIECAMLVESHVPISVAAFNVAYDCFYDCILSVLPRANPVIMTYITTLDDGTLEMRSVIECAIGLTEANAISLIPQQATSPDSWTAVQSGIARDLKERLEARGADFTVTLDEGLVNATVHVATDKNWPAHAQQGGDC